MLSDRVSVTPIEALQLLESDGIDPASFAIHIGVLHDYKLVELVDVPGDEGGFHYRLTPKAYVENTVWHEIPYGLREAAWAATLQALLQHSIAALTGGTIDRRGGQCNLLCLALDELGWEKVAGALADTQEVAETARRESAERVLGSPGGEALLSPAMIGLTAFEPSPYPTEGGTA